MRIVNTDVLVVGAGPAGLTAAALLAAYGVDAVTITKYPGTAHTPRAHITNQRTMEILRELGVEDRVYAVAMSAAEMALPCGQPVSPERNWRACTPGARARIGAASTRCPAHARCAMSGKTYWSR
ncbi:MAG: FAD-dependent monooxygenase [Mycobacterium sp.]|nr:FAD-dependent monooxygenase [Mycobacterium sp.]